jgi:hypothetical protein
MKKIILIFLTLSNISFPRLTAQSLVGILNNTVNIAPSAIVPDGTQIGISGSFQNKGASILTGTVLIRVAVDTSSTSIHKYNLIQTSSPILINNLAPNGAQFFAVSNVGATTGNGFKINGGGNLVVVWPIFNSDNLTIHDSTRITIYLTIPNNINDINDFENNSLNIQNPLTESVVLNYDEVIYKQVLLINNMGQSIAITNKKIDVTTLTKGLYYLKFYHQITGKFVTKRIIID